MRLTASEVAATGAWIAGWQLPSGMIPWFPEGHADPWNHVEATMALSLAGRVGEAVLSGPDAPRPPVSTSWWRTPS